MNRELNAIKSGFDSRDYKFVASYAPQPNTDLRAFNRDIEDQASQGSCTGHAITNVIELMTQRDGQWEDLSRQFQYYVTRDLEGLLGKSGTYSLRDCFEASRKLGICLESEWPYSPAHAEMKPTEAAYTSALTRKIGRYEAIDIWSAIVYGSQDYSKAIHNIKAALAEGMPVVFATALGEKFYYLTGPLSTHNYYLIDYPGQPATGNGYVGVHAMVIVGNDDALGCWIVENQWGTGWGDGGYCAIPYECVRDFSEAWVVRSYKDISYTNPVLYARQRNLVALYVAMFNRAPERSGFDWWLNAVADGVPLADVAQGFLDSAESKALYTNNGAAVCAVLESVDTFKNKLEVASYFTLDLACDKSEIAAQALVGVTEDVASVEVAKKRIRLLIHGGVL